MTSGGTNMYEIILFIETTDKVWNENALTGPLQQCDSSSDLQAWKPLYLGDREWNYHGHYFNKLPIGFKVQHFVNKSCK